MGLMEPLYECLKSPTKHGYEKEFFWLSGVTFVAVGFVGLIGNILSLLVLCRKKFRKNSFYNLLTMLAFFDMFFILTFGINTGYENMACRDHNYNHNLIHITYPIFNFMLVGSTYSTVAVSLERYLRLHHPHSKHWRKSWVYAIIVFTICIAYNFPRFFEYRYEMINGTLVAEVTPWTTSDIYENGYHFWAMIFIEDIIPIIMMIVLNGAIVKKMYFTEASAAADRYRKNRATTTKILLSIVGVFFMSHIPCIALSTLYFLTCVHCSHSVDNQSHWIIIRPLTELGLMINSSINFIIYAIMGKRFRDRFLKLFGCKNSYVIRD